MEYNISIASKQIKTTGKHFAAPYTPNMHKAVKSGFIVAYQNTKTAETVRLFEAGQRVVCDGEHIGTVAVVTYTERGYPTCIVAFDAPSKLGTREVAPSALKAC